MRAREPEVLATWYAEHLGIEVESWNGAVLRSAGGETLVWALFPGDTEYFGPRDRQELLVVIRQGNEWVERSDGPCVFVPLIGSEGFPHDA